MSIFSKLRWSLLLIACMSFSSAAAQEITYSPEFVDSFMLQNTREDQVSDLIGDISDAKVNEQPVWDVQHLKEKKHTPSLILVLPLVVLLLIAIKFLFKGFYNSSMSGIINGKVFQLHYRNKKYSEPIPLFFLFILRNIVMVIICQYIAYFLLKESIYLNLKHFIIGFVLVSLFYSVIYLIEYFVQNIIGVGNLFKMYFTQYFLITTWCWLPMLAFILIIYLNGIVFDANQMMFLLIVPVLLFSILAIIRSIILWNGAWRDNLLYFFIYLCTFKIIPYLIILKFIHDVWA